MKIIKDPIHDFIEVKDEELKLIDNYIFQRLRYIKQLGVSYLVYPGALHSRFEHSLGVMHIASSIYLTLVNKGTISFSKEDLQKLRIAGLLHDIGHVAFSHALEGIIIKSNHEEVTKSLIKNSEIGDIILDLGFQKREIINLIEGKGEFGIIINSQLDADRLDYLLRDAYYTGANYGNISLKRIIYTMKLKDGKIIFDKKGLIALENFLIARYQMYFSVYLHHTTIFFTKLLQLIVEKLIEKGYLHNIDKNNIEDIIMLTDDYILYLIKTIYKKEKDERLKHFIYRFLYRKPYKMIFEKFSVKNLEPKIKLIEEKIYSKYNNEDIIISCPTLQIYSYNPKIKKKSILIENNGIIRDIFNVSKIINRISHTPYYILRVYVNPEKINNKDIDEIKNIIKKI